MEKLETIIDINKLANLKLSANQYLYLYLKVFSIDKQIKISEDEVLELKSKSYIDSNNNIRAKSKRLFNVKDEDLDVENWISEYRDLFPTGVKSGGYPVKGIKSTCLNNMKKFIQKTGYSKNEILEAAKVYIEIKERENYRFMILAHYFIYKDNQSMLESFIEDLKERGNQFNEFHTEI